MRDFVKIEKDMGRIEFLDSRYYQHASGVFLPSVTTILDAYPKNYAFYEWLKQVGENADEIRDEAGKKGSIVHQLCEDLDSGFECTMTEETGGAKYKELEWAMFERYCDFRERFPEYELLANEQHYMSLELGFAGTLDRVFLKDGKRILVDLKTGNAIHNHFWLQLAAYKMLWDEFNPGYPIDEIKILWLNAKTRTEGKKGDFQGVGWQLKESENTIEHYWNVFKGVFQTWKEENKLTKPRNRSYQLTHKLNLNGNEKINSQIGHLQESK